MHDVIVLQYEDGYSDTKVLGPNYCMDTIRAHLAELHVSDNVEVDVVGIVDNEVKHIRFYLTDNTDVRFYVDALFEEVTP